MPELSDDIKQIFDDFPGLEKLAFSNNMKIRMQTPKTAALIQTQIKETLGNKYKMDEVYEQIINMRDN